MCGTPPPPPHPPNYYSTCSYNKIGFTSAIVHTYVDLLHPPPHRTTTPPAPTTRSVSRQLTTSSSAPSTYLAMGPHPMASRGAQVRGAPQDRGEGEGREGGRRSPSTCPPSPPPPLRSTAGPPQFPEPPPISLDSLLPPPLHRCMRPERGVRLGRSRAGIRNLGEPPPTRLHSAPHLPRPNCPLQALLPASVSALLHHRPVPVYILPCITALPSPRHNKASSTSSSTPPPPLLPCTSPLPSHLSLSYPTHPAPPHSEAYLTEYPSPPSPS